MNSGNDQGKQAKHTPQAYLPGVSLPFVMEYRERNHHKNNCAEPNELYFVGYRDTV